MIQNIAQQIAAEIEKVPARLKDNFLVRATINSIEELGPEGVLDQLKDINKYAHRRSAGKSAKFPELTIGLKENVKAGKSVPTMIVKKRKAK